MSVKKYKALNLNTIVMPENMEEIWESFSKQAENFENDNMSFAKKEYLDYTVKCMGLKETDIVLEAAAGTCACGRSIAPFVESVKCLDATEAMLDVARKEAESVGILNIEFIEGLVENIPFENETFDIVLSRLAFHHFRDIEKPFEEMNRVLKKGGKLVIIDMEAAKDDLRSIEDSIEKMRDNSHEKNISRSEFLNLYKKYGLKVKKEKSTRISVDLKAWLELTKTSKSISNEIRGMLKEELDGGEKIGFEPYISDREIYFWQRWLLIIGEKN